MTAPSATVVIPARNAEATIGLQLQALCRQDDPDGFAVLVVDNLSTDQTAAVARAYEDRLPQLQVLTCVVPGASQARNAGLFAADSDVVLFCDADDEVDPAWVREMRAALTTADAVGGTTDDVTLAQGSQVLSWVAPHDPGIPVVAGFLPRAILANLGVRSDVARQLGGFNTDYPYGGEDTEFCWRLQLAGHTLTHAPGAVVRYRRRGDLAGVLHRSYIGSVERPHLFRDFGAYGMPRSLAGGALRMVKTALHTPKAVVDKAYRPVWRREVAISRGRIVGSWKYRTLYL